MELRTRSDQRELDTGRVTLRETGRDLQKSGNRLRLERIDRSKFIELKNQAVRGAQRAAEGREPYAESRSPEIGYVLRTLPPELRKHWDSLPEMKQREIIERALASADRKGSGEMADAPLQEKNRVRKYEKIQHPEQGSPSNLNADRAGSSTSYRRDPEHTGRQGNSSKPASTRKKYGEFHKDEAGDAGEEEEYLQEIIRAEENENRQDVDDIQADEKESQWTDHEAQEIEQMRLHDSGTQANAQVIRKDNQELRTNALEIRTEAQGIREDDMELRVINHEIPEPSGIARQHTVRRYQPEHSGNDSRSSNAPGIQSNNHPKGKNTDRVLPGSGYETRLAGKRTRVRTIQNTGGQMSEREDVKSLKSMELSNKTAVYDRGKDTGKSGRQRAAWKGRIAETGLLVNGEETDERTRRTSLQAAGKEYGKRDSLKKGRETAEEKQEVRTAGLKYENETGLRTTGHELEDRSMLRTADHKLEDRSGLRTTDQELDDRSGLRIKDRDLEDHSGMRGKRKEKNSSGRQIAGKETESKSGLKNTVKGTSERIALRTVDQKGINISGLRTTDQKPEKSSELRITSRKAESESGKLRTLHTDRFQKTFSDAAGEENCHPGSGKKSTRKSKDKRSASAGAWNGIADSQHGSTIPASEKTTGKTDRKEPNSLKLEDDKSGMQVNGAVTEAGNSPAGQLDGTEHDREGNQGQEYQRYRSGAPGSGRKRKPSNNPEEAPPSQGNRNNAVHLIKRRKADDKVGTASSHFVTAFTNLVKADFAKAGQISQEKKRIQVEGSLEEYQDETASRSFRLAVTPLRIAAKTAARAAAKKIAAGIASATAAAINMLLPALIVLLPVLLIAGILPGLMGTLIAEEEEEAGYNVGGDAIVEYARQWIGKTKYIYGAGRNGALDWQDYADCSSFVHGVFSHFGVEIGWTTVEQENSGTKVCENSLSSAEPGDIVLFYDGGSIRSGGSGHVGIYSGGGNMVHNSSSKGTVVEAPVSYQNRPYVVRRITVPFTEDRSGGGGNATGGHRKDPTNYTQSQLELIWAIVAQEDNGSYKGALAVISSAMNRTESSKWSYCGSTAMEQLTAPGQYCYSNDTYWIARLGGNVPDYVKTAVNDCLKKGIRNHNHTSFRSTKGKVTGPDAVQIGGNWFFDY